MKAICDGQRTKNDVVQQSVEQYRAVYLRTKEQIGVLKAVGCMHFFVACRAFLLTLKYYRLFRNISSISQR
jgi:DNA topoisomerase III